MSLNTLFKSKFQSGDRSRGAAYFRNGRVAQVTDHGTKVSAQVAGTYHSYHVVVECDSRGAGVSCTCPRFGDGFACKHLWAVLLACDQQGLNPFQNVNANTLAVTSNSNKQKPNKAEAAKRARRKTPRWQTILNCVEHQDSENPKIRLQTQQTNEQILYAIDVGSNVRANGSYGSHNDNLQIQLLKRKQNKDETWAQPRPYTFSQRSIEGLSTSLDQQIARQLLGSMRKTKDYVDYQQLHSPAGSFEIAADWPSGLLQDLLDVVL